MGEREFRKEVLDFINQLNSSDIRNDKDAEEVFGKFNRKLLNQYGRAGIDRKDQEKPKKAFVLKDNESKEIIRKMFQISLNNDEVKDIWFQYPNILKINYKNVKSYLDGLIKNICIEKPVPTGLLKALFSKRVNVVNRVPIFKGYIQALFTVENPRIKENELSEEMKNQLSSFVVSGGEGSKILNHILATHKKENLFDNQVFINFCQKYNILKERCIDIYGIIRNIRALSIMFTIPSGNNDEKLKYNNTILVEDHKSNYMNEKNIYSLLNAYFIRNPNIEYKIKTSVFLDNVFKMCWQHGDNKSKILTILKERYKRDIRRNFFEAIENLEIDHSKDLLVPDNYNQFSSSTDRYPKDDDFYSCRLDISNVQEIKTLDNLNEFIKLIKTITENGEKDKKAPFFYFDIKLKIDDKDEELAYINIKYEKKYYMINCSAFNVTQIKGLLNEIFGNANLSLVVYDYGFIKEKLSKIYKELKDHITKPKTNIFDILNILKSFVGLADSHPEIIDLFPDTCLDVFRYKDKMIKVRRFGNDGKSEIEYRHRNNIANMAISRDGKFHTTIKRMIRIFEFSQATQLILDKEFDNSEDTVYSFWQRNPLREAQKSAALFKINALEDMFKALRKVVYSKKEREYYHLIEKPISKTELFFKRYQY
uniref:DNA helicase n=1 Tax=Parastrongyloides trichosuri TaxID=131310 RepID=A0A0N5A3V1_PARTI